MKLIIDIPEADWERYKKTQSEFGARESVAIKSIVNGTPLDDVKAEIDQKQYDFMANTDYDEGIRFGLMLAYQIVDKAEKGGE